MNEFIYIERKGQSIDSSDIKICDFGLAVHVGKGVYDLKNQAGGTLLFQAPEQASCVSYSKPIDIWACGFIMYFLLSHGRHPVLDHAFTTSNSKFFKFFQQSNKNLDELYEYKKKLTTLTKEDINIDPLVSKFYSDKWKCLFEKLWEIKPNLRYQSARALKHPWITKEENGRVPMNMYDELQLSAVLFDKLKLIQKSMLCLSVLKDGFIQQNKMKDLDQYKWRIIKEEFLVFDPTPKSSKNKNGQIQVSFNRQTSNETIESHKEEQQTHDEYLSPNIEQNLIIPKSNGKL